MESPCSTRGRDGVSTQRHGSRDRGNRTNRHITLARQRNPVQRNCLAPSSPQEVHRRLEVRGSETGNERPASTSPSLPEHRANPCLRSGSKVAERGTRRLRSRFYERRHWSPHDDRASLSGCGASVPKHRQPSYECNRAAKSRTPRVAASQGALHVGKAKSRPGGRAQPQR